MRNKNLISFFALLSLSFSMIAKFIKVEAKFIDNTGKQVNIDGAVASFIISNSNNKFIDTIRITDLKTVNGTTSILVKLVCKDPLYYHLTINFPDFVHIDYTKRLDSGKDTSLLRLVPLVLSALSKPKMTTPNFTPENIQIFIQNDYTSQFQVKTFDLVLHYEKSNQDYADAIKIPLKNIVTITIDGGRYNSLKPVTLGISGAFLPNELKMEIQFQVPSLTFENGDYTLNIKINNLDIENRLKAMKKKSSSPLSTPTLSDRVGVNGFSCTFALTKGGEIKYDSRNKSLNTTGR